MTESLLTKRGVCHKLEYSPYNYTYMHFGKPVTFNFSSKLHLEKFANLRKKNFTMIYNDILQKSKRGQLLNELHRCLHRLAQQSTSYR